ncbi:hypothetical protein LTR86_003351 [Recurvomyces mirabilis]|nr:hypothetical protein LTR86_003351 [Recurvomyces mirabilis]
MANVEYSSTLVERSRTVKRQDGVTVTSGCWIRQTIDRIIDRPLSSTTFADVDHVYSPLPPGHIRLLRLFPGAQSDPLRGELYQSRLSADRSDESFEALSYCWGEAKPERKFYDGLNIGDTPLPLTENLHAALRQFRHSHQPRTLWVDAVCINQIDELERADQVQKIFDIYGSADRVLLWLGPETLNSPVGMNVLRHILLMPHTLAKAPWERLPHQMLRDGIADIFERAYFTRMWVVQEASVAKDILMSCGTHQVAWRNDPATVRGIQRSIKLAAISPQWAAAGLEQIDMDLFLQLLQLQLESGPLSKDQQPVRSAPDLLDVAYELRHRHVTEPRDRYYAILGVASRTTGQNMTVDYMMPVEDVHARVQRLVNGDGDSDSDHRMTLDTIEADSAAFAEQISAIPHNSQDPPGFIKCGIVHDRAMTWPAAYATTQDCMTHHRNLIPSSPTSESSTEQQDTLRQSLSTASRVQFASRSAIQLVNSGKRQEAAAILRSVASDLESAD